MFRSTRDVLAVLVSLAVIIMIQYYYVIFPSPRREINIMLINGFNALTDKNYTNAYKHFLDASKLGSVEAFDALLTNYKDYSQLLDLYSIELKNKADRGDINSQIYMGMLYYKGVTVEKDYMESAKYFKMASVQGNPYASARLAEMYIEGRGVEQDYQKALELAQASYNAKNYSGEYVLGIMYYNGFGVEQDKAKAVAHIKHVADKSLAMRPIRFLASIYNDQGSGFYNFVLAEKYYSRLAAAGDPDSIYALALMYYNDGDMQKAKPWLKDAAERGYSAAMFTYASILATEKVDRPSYPEAYQWFTLAAEDYPQAITMRDAMAKRMTREQLIMAGAKDIPPAPAQSGSAY